MRLALLLLLPSLLVSAESGRRTAGHFEFEDYEFQGAKRHFAVWLPPGYHRGDRAPAIVYLHGAGESGTDGRAPTRVGLGPALEAHPRNWPFVVVFPQKTRAEQEWWEEEEIVRETIRRARRQYDFDSEHMALVGMSQGGHGVWMLGARDPTRWACLVPVCGYGRPRTIATRVTRVPVWAFHGLRDDQVNPSDTRQIVEAIRAERTRLDWTDVEARMTLYPDANHNAWDPAFAERELPRWILRQTTR